MKHRAGAAMLAVIAIFASAGCTRSTHAFRIGVIPYENPQTEKEEYQKFGTYIGEKVGGNPAEVSIASDYVGVVTALENSQVDAAYLNPLSYAIAIDRSEKAGHPLIPIAMPFVIMKGQTHGSLTYQGVIFCRADSGIAKLSDLKGKSFAFNEQTSTSGYLYPAALLIKNGVSPKPAAQGGDFKEVYFAGAQGVVPAVYNRQADAGAIFEEGIRLSLKEPSKIAEIKVLAKTDPIPNGMLVARGDLPADQVQKLKDALQTINSEPEGQTALAAMHVEKWVPADDKLFDPVRKTAQVLHLTLQSLEKKG